MSFPACASDVDAEASNYNPGGNEPSRLCEYCRHIPFREEDYIDASTDCSFQSIDRDGQPRLQYISSDIEGDIIKLNIKYDRTDTLPGLPSIRATADAGCTFCEILLASHFIHKCSNLPAAASVTLKLGYKWNRTTSRLLGFSIAASVQCRNGETRYLEEPAFCSVESEADDPCTYWLGIKMRPQSDHQTLEEQLRTVGKWVDECLKKCHPREENSAIPTRLLDLGPPQESPETVRLVQTDDDTDAREWLYTALSHCWGYQDHLPPRTTTETLPAHLSAIPLAALPQNYRDAITVTRSLGLRYIWIDSLCILQDSIHDWDRESSRMAAIYQHAHVTVVAASGTTCHSGFLQLRPSRRVLLNYGPSSTAPSVSGAYQLRERRGIGARDIEQSRWRTRAWTFQESLFSVRKLFFTDAAAYFQCGGALCASGGGRWQERGEKTPQQQRRYRHGEHFRENLARVAAKAKSTRDFYHGTWYGRIQEYSGRGLTVPQDRLVAVAAWAGELARAREGRYLAGMWEDSLCYWLLWCCPRASAAPSLEERLRFAAGPEFVAPSWSWASQTHKVHWQWPIGLGWKCVGAVAEVLDAEVIPRTSNVFGSLASGCLKIKGSLCSPTDMPLRRVDRGPYTFLENESGLSISLDWVDPCMAADSGQEGPQIINKDLMMLKLVTTGNGSNVGGLMLLPADKPDEYWRVGVFIIRKGLELERRDAEVLVLDEEERTIQII
ncbi:heterokaryon incompatibility protein-domain-containing protein [Macrophomina phaseolina]|uniref:Heterokaryon incompatibility protein-domain-containing protein n=1 Tax=Macrophomina phaseolina TaxID=35725 RepID=A0ABQ8G0L1_9PEZI|nr:heterokaryon incompatibility protein-domain-containing protein [Macrophomina phaseolina]